MSNFNLASLFLQNPEGVQFGPIAKMIGERRSSFASVNNTMQKRSPNLCFVRLIGAVAETYIWMRLDSELKVISGHV